MMDHILEPLKKMGIQTQVFYDVEPDPTLDCVNAGVKEMNAFQPDVIIAMGGGSPMDAAKIMWVLYEHPTVDFEGLTMRFMDIRKRIYKFPKLGSKASMVAIPTTSGTGSEVTPFAVVTDAEKGIKYPIADYELTPDIAILDPELVLSMPKNLTAWSGLDALVHALEAYVSVFATEFTNPYALQAIDMLFKYLERSYKNGADDVEAKEKVHYAANIAGMAFANSFLGVCHSLAHKLGSQFHVPHGLANALIITEVIKFNAVRAPRKQAIFPQYKYPSAVERYAEIARYIGLEGKTDEVLVKKLIEKIEKLKIALDIPKNIREAGVAEPAFLGQLEEMAEQAFDDQCTGANPRYPSIEELEQLYKNCFYAGK